MVTLADNVRLPLFGIRVFGAQWTVYGELIGIGLIEKIYEFGLKEKGMA
jgi:hypothetical protein